MMEDVIYFEVTRILTSISLLRSYYTKMRAGLPHLPQLPNIPKLPLATVTTHATVAPYATVATVTT